MRSKQLQHIRTVRAQIIEQNMQDLQDIKKQIINGNLMRDSFGAETKQHAAVEAEIELAVQNKKKLHPLYKGVPIDIWTEADRSAMQELLSACTISVGLPRGRLFKCALEEMKALINDGCRPDKAKDFSDCCMEAYCNFTQVMNGREKHWTEQTLRKLLEWWVGND